MDICTALTFYILMSESHVDTVRRHVEIANAGKHLQHQCEELKKKQQKELEKRSVGQTKLEPKDK